MDRWFGTFAGAKDDLKKIWKGKNSGMKHNTTAVHGEKQAEQARKSAAGKKKSTMTKKSKQQKKRRSATPSKKKKK
jgi:hypothetical protein